MINHYTANRKVRNDDAYSPGGQIGRRPDRATLAYCQRAREAFKGVPVIAGGVEASLRRIAHYDYWSDKVRRSILLDCKADLLVSTAWASGRSSKSPGGWRPAKRCATCAILRGVAYRLGRQANTAADEPRARLALPSYEAVSTDQLAFCRDDQDLAQRDQSAQRPAARATSRPRSGRGQSAGAAAGAAGDGSRLRPAVHPQAASGLRRAKHPGLSRW